MHSNVDSQAHADLSMSGEDLESLEPILARDTLLILLAGTAIGAALAGFVLPSFVLDMASSLRGDEPKAYWYLSRASGVVAYVLLWLASVLGLTLTNRFARLWAGGPAIASVHQFVSLLGLALVAFHVSILLGDRYVNYRLDQLLVPFASSYEPVWVGLGQLAGYVVLPVTFSFYVRRLIGVRCWRLIHYASFAVFFLSVAHGLGAGTDSSTPLMAAVYMATCSVTVFLTVYRVAMTGVSPGT
jgi:predicted ferric reductase